MNKLTLTLYLLSGIFLIYLFSNISYENYNRRTIDKTPTTLIDSIDILIDSVSINKKMNDSININLLKENRKLKKENIKKKLLEKDLIIDSLKKANKTKADSLKRLKVKLSYIEKPNIMIEKVDSISSMN